MKALAALRRDQEVRALGTRFRPAIGKRVDFAMAAGLSAAGYEAEAAAVLRDWMARDSSWAVDTVASLSTHHHFERLYQRGLLQAPTVEEFVAGLVARHLSVSTSIPIFHGLPPGIEGQQILTGLFGARPPGETVLFTAFQKYSFVLGITEGGIVWKGGGDGSQVFTLSFGQIDTNYVAHDGPRLLVGPNTILCGDAEIAIGVAALLSEAALAQRL
jgi:hypothetical protein